MNKNISIYSKYIVLILSIVIIYIFEIFFFKQKGFADSDYRFYMDYVKNIILSGIIPNDAYSNPLYIFLMLIIYKIFKFSINTIGYYIVPLISYALLGIILFKKIKETLAPISSLILTLCLMLIGPISIFTFPNLLFAYIGIHNYHCPTQILSQPFALGTFIILIYGLEKKTNSLQFLFGLGAVTILSLLAKPTYLICLIPALGLLAIFRILKKSYINKSLIAFIFSISFFVLLAEYWFTYGSGGSENESKIILAPYEVWQFITMLAPQFWHYYGISDTPANRIIFAPLFFLYNFPYALPVRLLLSFLFPATVYFCFFDDAKKNTGLNLAWLTFGIALFYSFFLGESGPRLYHGNFLWGLQSSLFILFFSSTMFLIKEKDFRISTEIFSFKKNPRRFLCSVIFCLHLVSGLAYYGKITYGGWYG